MQVDTALDHQHGVWSGTDRRTCWRSLQIQRRVVVCGLLSLRQFISLWAVSASASQQTDF